MSNQSMSGVETNNLVRGERVHRPKSSSGKECRMILTKAVVNSGELKGFEVEKRKEKSWLVNLFVPPDFPCHENLPPAC